MSIGERITELRKSRHLSQGQLAALLEVSRQAVSKWESDQTFPDTRNLLQLADILDTDIEYLAAGHRSQAIFPASSVIPATGTKPEVTERIKVLERIVEKPVFRTIVKTEYRRRPFEFFLCGICCFLFGLAIGILF